jgi:hypothetical protein
MYEQGIADAVKELEQEINYWKISDRVSRAITERTSKPNYLDELLPDEDIYSLTERQRMELVTTHGLTLRSYGVEYAQWNGRLERVKDPAVMLSIAGYGRRESVQLTPQQTDSLLDSQERDLRAIIEEESHTN